MAQLNPYLRGILYALLSYTLWVVVDGLIKGISEYHVPVYEITLVMSIVIAMTIFIFERRDHDNVRQTLAGLLPNRFKPLLFIALLNFIASYTCVVALAHLPLNIFYVSVFTAPLTICLLSYYFLKESLDKRKIVAVMIGFAGIVFALWPTQSMGGDALGYTAALACATSYAASVTLSRKVTQTEGATSITFINAVVQILLSSVICFVVGGDIALSPLLILLLVLAGIINTGGNFYSYRSVAHTPASIVSAYHYSQMLTGALVAYVVWHEVPSERLMIGALIIVATGIYIALHTHEETMLTPPSLTPH